MRLEDNGLNLKEGSFPTLFPSKDDIETGSEIWGNRRLNLMLLYTQVPPPQKTPSLNTTSLSGRRHKSLTVQATPPYC